MGDPIYKYEQVLVGTVDQKYCKGYNYYRDVKETTTTYAIKVNEPETCTNVSTLTWPTDTLSTRYEFLGFDWQCVGCETVPRKVWKKCTRKVGVVTSSNTVTTSGISVTCSEFETKKVQVFGTAKVFVDYDIIRTPVYRDVYKYKARTRTKIKDAYTVYAWSYMNDQSLLNDGYVMTNVTRIV